MPLQVYDEAWLGGLWEAEGCVRKARSAKSGVSAKLNMADIPTVKHAARLAGNIGTFHYRKRDQPQHRQQLQWDINRFEHQLVFLGSLVPYLFKRRVARINELMGTDIPYKQPVLTVPWLAGYFEGEGSFNSGSGYPRIRVDCTDRDVLLAIQAYYKVGDVVLRKRRMESTVDYHNVDRWQDTYRWYAPAKESRDIMREIYPYMSVRRQFQIDCVLAK